MKPAWLLLLACGVHGQAKFTLDQVMSAPFPSALTASPTGGRVAWVLNERGARNVWMAGAPDYQGRRVTSYQADDGQEIAELAWTPEGKSLLYVRGGDFEMGRANPNPASLPGGVEQSIYVVTPNGNAPRKLAEGKLPAVSREGRVAYLHTGQLWSVGLENGAKAERLFETRGTFGGYAWSPDGRKLLFVSLRNDHSFIGVYDLTAKTITWMDPSVDEDNYPVWSPDAQYIAWIRVPVRTRAFSFGPVRDASPWSIRIAEVASGRGREIWKAHAGPGSAFHEMASERQLLWGDGNRIVFPYEGSGWQHLYSVSAAGGAAEDLTPGASEVESAVLTRDRKGILYCSNQGDIDRRHLWRVAPGGGPAAGLTERTGIEWSPVDAGDGAIAFLHSDARMPGRPAVQLTNGTPRDLAPAALPHDFPAAALVAPEAVLFKAPDGQEIHGQLFLPPNPAPAQKPALLFLHGGSRRQMLLGWHYMEYYNNSYAMNQYLAALGYVVLSVNYRSGIGYGLDFREALQYGATGASEYQDVLGAATYLRARPDVDPKRLGLWGGSYGGYLTALGLARNSDLFAAGVDFHGVHDWNDVIHNFVSEYDPGKDKDAAKLAFTSSPLDSVKGWKSPVLLIHGDDDRNVPFHQTVRLVEALRAQGTPFEELVFPDEVHDLLLHRNWLRAYEATAEFFGRKLKAL